jgi:poly-beta-1,6-N-acetyl-D-glucosamine synthase
LNMTKAIAGKYALITPAKNEAKFIEQTIASVIAQTLKPEKWVIVDDGSADDTAAIVEKYLRAHEFIRLIKISGARNRLFSNKANAFKAGLQQLAGEDYAYIGNLDADITLPPEYYENVIDGFERDPRLGIAGGIVYTKFRNRFVTGDSAPDSVAGAIQLFRRECFEQIGGYLPLRRGGIDAAAEIMARMTGWTVRKDPNNKVYENRQTGSATSGTLAACFNMGIRFHSLGYSPVFYAVRSIYKMTESPAVIGSLIAVLGFISAGLLQYPISLPADAVSYLRAEQMAKLKQMLFGFSRRTCVSAR